MIPGRQVRPRVLIVDDEPETCVLLQAYLEEARIEVAGLAYSGEAAVSVCHDLCPDVVLMDVRMPGMNGLEATELIKKDDPAIPVILLTFYDEIDWTISVERTGAFCYLLKGCPPSMIVDMVRQAWEYRRENRGMSAPAG